MADKAKKYESQKGQHVLCDTCNYCLIWLNVSATERRLACPICNARKIIKVLVGELKRRQTTEKAHQEEIKKLNLIVRDQSVELAKADELGRYF